MVIDIEVRFGIDLRLVIAADAADEVWYFCQYIHTRVTTCCCE